MPYLESAQSWLTQSTLLIQARPTTTRITTKYHLRAPPDPSKLSKKPRKARTANATPAEEPTRATLVLKTYDPVSGTVLKYQTNKGHEVSRLVQILGRLARPMAGLEVEVGGGDAGNAGESGGGNAGEGGAEVVSGVEGKDAATGKRVGLFKVQVVGETRRARRRARNEGHSDTW